MHEGLRSLLALLDLREVRSTPTDACFEGPASHERHIRAFGGQVAAQALVAAARTVQSTRPVHSLHSYFLRPGAPDLPLVCDVKVVRDGRSFSTRHVEASQDGKVIFELSASFHHHEVGVEHTDSMPEAPHPDSLLTFEERFSGRQEELERWFVRARPFDIRYVDATPFDPPSAIQPARQQVWVRTAGELPDDQSLHRSIAAYASDMTVLDAVLLAHGMQWTDRHIMGASLDHAMWFHQPFRADEWLLFDQQSPIAHGGRGLARAEVWTQDGRLVISVVQEALLRPPGT